MFEGRHIRLILHKSSIEKKARRKFLPKIVIRGPVCQNKNSSIGLDEFNLSNKLNQVIMDIKMDEHQFMEFNS